MLDILSVLLTLLSVAFIATVAYIAYNKGRESALKEVDALNAAYAAGSVDTKKDIMRGVSAYNAAVMYNERALRYNEIVDEINELKKVRAELENLERKFKADKMASQIDTRIDKVRENEKTVTQNYNELLRLFEETKKALRVQNSF